jgi:mRNA-degrading endonuclease toxin of MazEF toxin-antitoxin module
VPHPQTPPRRGEIYWIDFNPVIGSEQGGRRPAVVISTNDFNRGVPVVAVAAITTSQSTRPSPIAVNLPAGRPLELASRILAFQVRTVDQSRLAGYLGCLDPQQVEALKAALRVTWDL